MQLPNIDPAAVEKLAPGSSIFFSAGVVIAGIVLGFVAYFQKMFGSRAESNTDRLEKGIDRLCDLLEKKIEVDEETAATLRAMLGQMKDEAAYQHGLAAGKRLT
ncbi:MULTISPECIES: hypothetical protein [unclassified Beijerinckia]|uniref:hypothetical protein n=1 Tax=unclassified Beijerinckia TaxID=2638183 RepID=UPI0008989383|nr:MULTISPECIES: hypothetical protein [unclassified Beijerinckia]MDH7796447.1 hypothetical protein [Beijerinckia sp. GAS462]SEC45497.1 hypothetical protein SAMN05443249_2729 [Beijerinckia sp. 28-YEA-48]